MRKIVCFLAVILFLSGCSAKRYPYSDLTNNIVIDETDVDSLVIESQHKSKVILGHWYTKQSVNDGTIKEEIATYTKDQNMILKVRYTHPNGETEIYEDLVVWGIFGSIYFNKTVGFIENSQITPVNKYHPDVFYTDWAYEIRKLTDEEFIYKTIGGVNTFRAIRVESSAFPD